MEISFAILITIFTLTFPGLLFVNFLFSNKIPWSLGLLSIIPVVSIGINYLFNYILSSLNVNINWKVVGISYLVGVIFVFRKSLKRINLKYFSSATFIFIFIATITVVNFLAWTKAYSGYSWLAPNADGFSHNFFASRILFEKSVLNNDVFVSSPLMHNLGEFSYFFFYPIAWHANVALGAGITSIPIPFLTLTSSIFISTFVLGLGLFALAKEITKNWKAVGAFATGLCITIPIFPGVPMTWGSMTNAVGISLLPGSVAYLSNLRNHAHIEIKSIFLGLFTIASLFFIHSSEAVIVFLLFVIIALDLLFNAYRNSKISLKVFIKNKFFISFIFITFIICLTFADEFRVQVKALTDQLGGSGRTFEETLGSMFTLSIRVPQSQYLFGILSLLGVLIFSKRNQKSFISIFFLILASIYLLSGANIWPLSELRFLTIPWYGSYERTAWTLMPFMCLLAAIPLAEFTNDSNQHSKIRVFGLTVLTGIFVLGQVKIGFEDTLAQHRLGVYENQIAGPGSRELFIKIRNEFDSDAVWLTQKGDGSLYAYMYEEINVTNGGYNSNGKEDPIILQLVNSFDVCSPEVQETINKNSVVGAIIGTRRYAWEDSPWSKRMITQLPGFKVIGESEDLVALKIERSACD